MLMNSEKGNRFAAALLAYVIPGAGHWYLGQKNRGTVLFITIGLTFLVGLILGSKEVVDPTAPGVMARMTFIVQMGCGMLSVLSLMIQDTQVSIANVYGRGVDLGQLYTVIAGLLNILCVLNLLEVRQKPETRQAN